MPHTEDMVSQLFDPKQPKNASDIAIVTVLAYLCGLLYFLPERLRVPVFAVIFLFWRTCYNGGIGWLLHQQSTHKRLTNWAKRSGIFENPESGKIPVPSCTSFSSRSLNPRFRRTTSSRTLPWSTTPGSSSVAW